MTCINRWLKPIYYLVTSLTIWLQNSNLEKVTKYCMARYTMVKTNKIYDQRTTEGLSGLEIPFLLASNSKNNVPAQHNMLSLVVCPFWIESWNPQNRKKGQNNVMSCHCSLGGSVLIFLWAGLDQTRQQEAEDRNILLFLSHSG